MLVISCFAGSTAQSGNFKHILKRIMFELKSRFKLTTEIPEEDEAIGQDFQSWIRMKEVANGKVLLVMDGLDELEDIDNSSDLAWIPKAFPENFRVIVSTSK